MRSVCHNLRDELNVKARCKMKIVKTAKKVENSCAENRKIKNTNKLD